jgi:hypothetical protein
MIALGSELSEGKRGADEIPRAGWFGELTYHIVIQDPMKPMKPKECFGYFIPSI